MQLIPVLEVRHGKCVHTEAKNNFANHVIKDDIFELVGKWQQQGIKRVHIVDVDAIESGEPENVDLISSLKEKYSQLEIQVLGGIQSIDSAYIWVDAGADYLVLNGKALRQRNLLDDVCVEFPGKVLVELDSRQGNVGMGAGEPTFSLANIAKQLDEDGVHGIIVTDIPETGHVNQLSLLCVSQASENIDMPVFANGGLTTLNDLKQLLTSQAKKMSGVLIGKALHNGFCLKQAHQLINEQCANI